MSLISHIELFKKYLVFEWSITNPALIITSVMWEKTNKFACTQFKSTYSVGKKRYAQTLKNMYYK